MIKKIEEEKREILRGDIYMMDLSPVIESEQGGLRPCLVVSNNFGNHYSPTVTILALTSSKGHKKQLPTHINVSKDAGFGLDKDSFILCESIRTVSRQRKREYLGKIDNNTLLKVENAIMINLGMFS